MKRAFIDASSAILLYKADIFEAVANAYRLFVVPAVYLLMAREHSKYQEKQYIEEYT